MQECSTKYWVYGSASGFQAWCISVCVHTVCLYQAAELEQSRQTRSVIIVCGCVSMGTGAPLPPQVFVVVNSMKNLVTVNCGDLSVILLPRLGASQRFDEVHLVLETHKPPVVQNRNFRVDKAVSFLKQISVYLVYPAFKVPQM